MTVLTVQIKKNLWAFAGSFPSWHNKLTPQMEGVLRAVSKVSGDCLDTPEISQFQPLFESLSPDALLAVGETIASVFTH